MTPEEIHDTILQEAETQFRAGRPLVSVTMPPLWLRDLSRWVFDSANRVVTWHQPESRYERVKESTWWLELLVRLRLRPGTWRRAQKETEPFASARVDSFVTDWGCVSLYPDHEATELVFDTRGEEGD